MAYHEVTVGIADHLRDAAIKKLYSAGCLGMIEQETNIVAYFPESVAIDTILTDLSLFGKLLELAGHKPDLNVTHCMLPDQDWNESWKKGFTAIDVGDRFTILPPWEEPRTDRINLVIDPAMAFGTGHHETTRSCLVLMEKYSGKNPRKDFLDIGSGTGILAIAASKLGWQNVVAIDIDPLAVDATRQNCSINQAAPLTVLECGVSDLRETYDFIAANLISGVLIELALELASHLRTGGLAVMSGILAGQEDEVIEASRNAGLRLIELFPDGKWVSLVWER